MGEHVFLVLVSLSYIWAFCLGPREQTETVASQALAFALQDKGFVVYASRSNTGWSWWRLFMRHLMALRIGTLNIFLVNGWCCLGKSSRMYLICQ